MHEATPERRYIMFGMFWKLLEAVVTQDSEELAVVLVIGTDFGQFVARDLGCTWLTWRKRAIVSKSLGC